MGKIVQKIKKICPNCKKEFEVRPCENVRMECCCKQCSHEYHSTELKCLQCGNVFRRPNSQKNRKFCSIECSKKYTYNSALEKRTCRYCGNIFKVLKSSPNLCCSDICYKKWKNEHGYQQYNCDYCGKEFTVLKSKVRNQNNLYCSHKCSTDANIKHIEMHCDNCGKIIFKMPSKIYDNNFCSDKCSREFYSKKRTEEKVCEYCGQNFVVKKSHVDIARFCSRECKDRWQSTDANCGENHPCFQGLTRKCAECGKTIPIRKHRLKIQENFFCNKECRIKYYKNPQNRTEKQKEASKAFAKNAIKYIKPTLTSPHKIINEILDKNSIIYRNEELIHYYKLDIYLPDFNLGIEVQGDFWHCSPIRYKNVIYERQRKCIIKDKAKHTYVKNKFGYEILYLWEKDINTNPKLCEKLIQKYIRNNGVLFNYHSFNYFLDRDKLELKNKIIVPYQDKNKIEYINLINT